MSTLYDKNFLLVFSVGVLFYICAVKLMVFITVTTVIISGILVFPLSYVMWNSPVY